MQQLEPTLFEWHGQRLWLSPDRCLFWEDKSTLVLTDVHIGKSAHFRKEGIAIPQQVFEADLIRFFAQVAHFKPERIIITGDLFHSHENLEHSWFGHWLQQVQAAEVVLVKGNHEILCDQAYEKLKIRVVANELKDGGFVFSHTLPRKVQQDLFYFTGHLHPGIKLVGKGRQSMVFPCFHFSPSHAVLPAFSRFTGKHVVEPTKEDHVFAIISSSRKDAAAPFLLRC